MPHQRLPRSLEARYRLLLVPALLLALDVAVVVTDSDEAVEDEAHDATPPEGLARIGLASREEAVPAIDGGQSPAIAPAPPGPEPGGAPVFPATSIPVVSLTRIVASLPIPSTELAPVPPPPPPPEPPRVWRRLAECESGGVWNRNTGNGYYGGLQFDLSTWRSVGGTGYPHEHSREFQVELAMKLESSAGWYPWPTCAARMGLIPWQEVPALEPPAVEPPPDAPPEPPPAEPPAEAKPRKGKRAGG